MEPSSSCPVSLAVNSGQLWIATGGSIDPVPFALALTSTIVSRFLLNLRQANKRLAGTDTRPSFVASRNSGMQSASEFITSMGAEMAGSFESVQADSSDDEIQEDIGETTENLEDNIGKTLQNDDIIEVPRV